VGSSWWIKNYLIAPSVIPEISFSLKNMNKIIVGMIEIAEAAKIVTQSLVYCNAENKEYKPRDNVLISDLVVNTRASIYSFHNAIKLKIPAVTMPGVAIGTIILKKV